MESLEQLEKLYRKSRTLNRTDTLPHFHAIQRLNLSFINRHFFAGRMMFIFSILTQSSPFQKIVLLPQFWSSRNGEAMRFFFHVWLDILLGGLFFPSSILFLCQFQLCLLFMVHILHGIIFAPYEYYSYSSVDK